MEASQGAPPAQAEPQAPEGEQPQDPDVRAELQALTQRVDSLAPAQPEQPQQPPPLADQLRGEPEEPEEPEGEPEFDATGLTPEQQQAWYEQVYGQSQADPELASQVENIQNYLVQRSQQENAAALEGLREKYPQLREEAFVNRVGERLLPLAEQYDDDSLLVNPQLVEDVTKSLIADEESAGAPAGEAADQGGAVLETGAGPSNQDEGPSYEKQRQEAIVAAAPRHSF
jgi:hypothetical protein